MNTKTKSETGMDLNKVISPILKIKKLTKDDIVNRLSVSRGTFYGWMRQSPEKRTIEELKSISEAIGVKITELIDKTIGEPIDNSKIELHSSKTYFLEERVELYLNKIEFLEEKVEFYKSQIDIKKV